MIMLEKLLLRLELALIQVQSFAVIPWCIRMPPDVLSLKLGLVNLTGVFFAMLSFRRFKQYFSRGCHASFAFGDFLHTPYSPHPKQQSKGAAVCVVYANNTL